MNEIKYSCYKCLKVFLSYLSLIRHVKFSHPHLDIYNCNQTNCHRTYKDLTGLRKHYQYDRCESINSNIMPNISQVIKIDSNLKQADIISPCDDEGQNSLFDVTANAGFDLLKNVSANINSCITQYISKLYENPSLPRNLVQVVTDN